MHSALTEMMMRDHAAELRRSTDRIVLPDGRCVVLRPLRRGDRTGLAGLVARLSSESRRRRFLTARTRLTTAELDHLSDVGQPGHEAMAAIDERDGAIIARAHEHGWPTLTATTFCDNAAARALSRRFGFVGRRGWPGEFELELQLASGSWRERAVQWR